MGKPWTDEWIGCKSQYFRFIKMNFKEDMARLKDDEVQIEILRKKGNLHVVQVEVQAEII